MGQQAWVTQFLEQVGEVAATLPDNRAGRHNQQYEMSDAVRGAFAVFHTQSASLPAHQRDMVRRSGKDNITTVHGAQRIPSDNHIRSLQDGAPAGSFAACYEWRWSALETTGIPAGYQALGDRLLVGLDGIQYFSSSKIHCVNCSQSEQTKGTCLYQNSFVTSLHLDEAGVQEIAQAGRSPVGCATASIWAARPAATIRSPSASPLPTAKRPSAGCHFPAYRL